MQNPVSYNNKEICLVSGGGDERLKKQGGHTSGPPCPNYCDLLLVVHNKVGNKCWRSGYAATNKQLQLHRKKGHFFDSIHKMFFWQKWANCW